MAGRLFFPSFQILIFLGVVVCCLSSNVAYEVQDESDATCLYASFDVSVYIYRNVSNNDTKASKGLQYSIENYSFKLPKANERNVTVSGECDNNGRYSLKVDWLDKTNFTLIMEFVKNTKNWTINKITFEFTLEYFGTTDIEDEFDCFRSYSTDQMKFFNRTFSADEYFYCDNCKLYQFSNASGACLGSQCSYLTLDNSRIYLGDYENDNPKKKLCLEDWIKEREIIVPIAVGGFLLFLVLVLILAYIGSFIKRKLKEKRSTSYSPLRQ